MSTYSTEAAQATIKDFLTNEELQKQLIQYIDIFCELCAAGAAARGFHDDEWQARAFLTNGIMHYRDVAGEEAAGKNLPAWLDVQLLQAEIGRIMSEAGEMIEAVRKPGPDQHLPDYPAVDIEAADILIRLGDTMAKRDWSLGQAAVAKLIYNASREYKHGKNS